jgi:spore maturation protein CgeB
MSRNVLESKSNLKILLVADTASFALTDVFYGYQRAMKSLNIAHEAFPYHQSVELLSLKMSYHLVHSTALIKDNGFTHVMFIGGLNIPTFIYNNLYHVKSVIVSTEDPHVSKPLLDNLDKIDYYFSNERTIGNDKNLKNTYYSPTAACPFECGKLPIEQLPEKYHSDILFLGAMYPNRVKLLEQLIPMVEKYKLSFKLCGHVGYMDKKSPLWKYVYDARTIPHAETISYYNGAKTVINILRDVNWNSRDNTHTNPYKASYIAESLNPRAYEVPLCQSFMLIDDSRAEARDIFTENEVGFFSDGPSLIKAVKYYLLGKGKNFREKMIFNAFRKVSENHTYSHRMLFIKSILEKSS